MVGLGRTNKFVCNSFYFVCIFCIHKFYTKFFGALESHYVCLVMLLHNSKILDSSQQLFKKMRMFNHNTQFFIGSWNIYPSTNFAGGIMSGALAHAWPIPALRRIVVYFCYGITNFSFILRQIWCGVLNFAVTLCVSKIGK